MRASDINELYAQAYADERLCHVGKDVPDVIEVEGKHGWKMGGVQVHSSGKRVVVVVSHIEAESYGRDWVLIVIAGRAGQPTQGCCDTVHAGEREATCRRNIG